MARFITARTQGAWSLSLGAGVLFLAALALMFPAAAALRRRAQRSEHSPREERAVEETALPESSFESGDIIFRRGLSLESRAVMTVDRRFGYSHVGIVRKDGTGVEVIHATFGEEGQAQEGIVKEPLAKFLRPSASSAAVAYRLNAWDKSLPLAALSEAERLLAAEIPFDKDFDLSTPDRIYCTELIWLVFKKAGVDLAGGRFDRVPYLVGDAEKDYILPSTLLNSLQLHKIWASQGDESGRQAAGQ